MMTSWWGWLEKAEKRFAARRTDWRERWGLVDNLRAEAVPPRTGRRLMVDRFSDVLSVVGYDPAHALFVMNRGGETVPDHLGRVWELTPLLSADDAAKSALLRILNAELPAGSTMAFSIYAEPQCDRVTEDFVAARSVVHPRLCAGSSDILRAMARERAELFAEAARRGALGGRPFAARHFRHWLAVTVPADVMTSSTGADEVARSAAESLLPVEAALKRAGLWGCRWNERDYVVTMRRLMNPQAVAAGTLRHPAVSPADVLRRSAVALSTRLDVGYDHMTFHDAEAGVEAVAVGVSGYPASIELNDMAALLGASGRAAGALPWPYVVTVVSQATDGAADRTRTAVKAARIRQLAASEVGQFLTDLPERSRDMDLAHEACEAGTGLARIAVEGVVFAPEGRGRGAAETLRSLFADAGFLGETDAGVQVMGLLTVLPLEAADGLMKDLQAAGRLSTKTKACAAQMLPVLGEWAGTGPRQSRSRATPLVLLTSRAGEVFGVDFFANRAGNYNVVVAGTSGSGKSVLAQEIVTGVLAGGGRVWVFDIGRSYRSVVELARGQWIDFEALADEAESAPFCLNPLDVAGNPDDVVDEVTDIVTVLANGDAPMELTEAALLKAAVADLMKASRGTGRPPTMTDLALRLTASSDPRLVNLAFRLAPYTAGERFGAWFEGANSVRFDAALVALEMEALTNKPILQQAVLLILIMRILQEIRHTPRDQVKLVVIDEAWRLLTGRIGRFIEWACRTLRKYGAGIVCISQSMEDFDASAAARAVRNNADTVFWLRQKSTGIRAATDNALLRRVLGDLTTEDGLFSEVFVRVGDGPGAVGRLVLDTFSLTAYSTRADVYEAVRRERAEGGAPDEAIRRVARRLLAPERGF